jgi:hypothetical protein
LNIVKDYAKLTNSLGASKAHRIVPGTTLRLTGSIHSTISKSSKDSIDIIYSLDFIESLLEIIAEIPEERSKNQSKVEQLWRTLIGDSSSFDLPNATHPAPPELGRSFYYNILHIISLEAFGEEKHQFHDLSAAEWDDFWLKHPLYESFAQTTDLLPDRAEITSRAAIMSQAYRDHNNSGQFQAATIPEMDDYLHVMTNVGMGRCLFITNEGRLGVTASSAREGDVIAFVRNSKFPLTLREIKDGEKGGEGERERRYRLVGEAYVHGLMDGEIGVLELEDILLE